MVLVSSWIEEKRNEGRRLFEALPFPQAPSRDRKFPTLLYNIEDKTTTDVANFESHDKRVILTSLSEALVKHEEIIRPYLTEIARPDKNKWVALNQAKWEGGAFVHLSKNLELSEPILIRHQLADSAFPRVLILAEPGSHAVILDEYDSDVPFILPVIEIAAMDDASVTYIQLQHCGKETHFYSTVKAIGNRHSNLKTFSFFIGGHRTVNQAGISLKGEGAQARLLGLTLGKEEQVFEHYTLQEHLAPNTESDLLMKVVLDDQAYSHFDGLIWIEKGAKKTGAYQQNRNLLLSKEAKAETTPRLEILDDDVRCTHGAAVGPVDEDHLFYLESRGISRETAQKLLVEGFSHQIFDQIPDPSVKKKLETLFGFGEEENG